MTGSGVVMFAGTLTLAAATPGVATMTTVARVVTRGVGGAAAFGLGLILGDLVWLTAAALGLSALAAHAAPVLLALRYAGALYLVVLAWAFWRAPPPTAGLARPSPPRAWPVLEGAVLQLCNPKAMLFYVALMPAVVPFATVSASDLAVLSAVVATVLGAVTGAYVALAVLARRHLQSARAMRVLHRLSATVMVAAAAYLAAGG